MRKINSLMDLALDSKDEEWIEEIHKIAKEDIKVVKYSENKNYYVKYKRAQKEIAKLSILMDDREELLVKAIKDLDKAESDIKRQKKLMFIGAICAATLIIIGVVL